MATVDTTAPVANARRRCPATRSRRVADDLAAEWRGRGKYPPGPERLQRRPHPCRSPTTRCRCCSTPTKSYGPIFSMRLLHTRVVFMLGPEANHFVTVGHPENFHWRESSFGDLIPLLGDGLLTIDDDYHDRARAIMLPAFHREQVEASIAAMAAEAGGGDRARCAPARWSTSTTGCAAWRCGSRCGRCSASTPTRRQGRRRGRALRAGARLLRDRLRRCACCAGPARPGAS